MLLPVLILLAAGPAKPTKVDYQKLLDADQQIINRLTQENKALQTRLLGNPGDKVSPRWVNEQPTCPVNGFEIVWSVEADLPSATKIFRPWCVRTK